MVDLLLYGFIISLLSFIFYKEYKHQQLSSQLSDEIVELQGSIIHLKHTIELAEEENFNLLNRLIKEATQAEKTKDLAIKKSREVNKGLEIETLMPLLDRFNPKDMCFLGAPIDYVCFDGLEDVYTGRESSLRGIVFIEVKSGAARLSKRQRRIRDWIKNNQDKITFELIRL